MTKTAPRRNTQDGFPIVVESRISLLNGIADPRPFSPGRRDGGTGLVFDCSSAPIVDSQINIESVLNYDTLISA